MSNQNNSTELPVIAISEKEINGETVSTVDARELHVALEVGTEFARWIERRISDYNFKEDEDFSSFLTKNAERGRPTQDYSLSLDMAKELCMLERSEIGRAARKYFIECEKKLYQAYSLSPSQEATLGGQLYTLVKDLEKTDSEFLRQFCLMRIDRLSLVLKQSMPETELLGQKVAK